MTVHFPHKVRKSIRGPLALSGPRRRTSIHRRKSSEIAGGKHCLESSTGQVPLEQIISAPRQDRPGQDFQRVKVLSKHPIQSIVLCHRHWSLRKVSVPCPCPPMQCTHSQNLLTYPVHTVVVPVVYDGTMGGTDCRVGVGFASRKLPLSSDSLGGESPQKIIQDTGTSTSTTL